MISVGTSLETDSRQAGRAMARQALGGLPEGESPCWALAFGGGRHSPDDLWQAMRSELGEEIPIVGGAAVGTITHELLGCTGYEVSLALFSNRLPKPTILSEDCLQPGEKIAGKRLGTRLREVGREGDTVLMFYDSIRSTPPPVLHVGSVLVDGLYEGLDGHPVTLIGGGLIGDHHFSSSYVWTGNKLTRHQAVAIVLPSALHSNTTIMHGCTPISSFKTITRIDGHTVYELDGRPAVEVLLEMLGAEDQAAALERLALTVTLGEKHGDRYAPYDESAYVNRLIMSADRPSGSVTLFEGDFQVGTKVQIMSRDNDMMIESVRRGTPTSLASIAPQQPVFALYIDCAGRCCAFNGAKIEEAGVLQSQLNPDIPLLGFYSGVEIAPFLGRSRPLDWTGVLTLLTTENP